MFEEPETGLTSAIGIRHSTLGRTWVSGPAHTFSVYGPTVMYYMCRTLTK